MDTYEGSGTVCEFYSEEDRYEFYEDMYEEEIEKYFISEAELQFQTHRHNCRNSVCGCEVESYPNFCHECVDEFCSCRVGNCMFEFSYEVDYTPEFYHRYRRSLAVPKPEFTASSYLEYFAPESKKQAHQVVF